MAEVSLASHMREQRTEADEDRGEAEAGPFITISRQFGCYGFSLGLLLMEILNENADASTTWRIYHREILERLATETNLAAELLDRQRRTKPGLLADFFRAVTSQHVPSGAEVRRYITMIIRGLAVDGYAIIIGQGGSAATRDLPNGLSVRLEAPVQWRVKEVAFREGLSETKARLRVKAMDQDREYLGKLYESRNQTRLPFDVIYDCSSFTLAQIAQHVAYAMKLKGCI